MTLIRYPGSKEKLAKQIIARFPIEMSLPLWMDHNGWEYREPFFGAGAIGFNVLGVLPPSCKAWINDKDFGLVCLWKAIQNAPKELKDRIEGFEPSIEQFYQFKEEDGRADIDPVETGFRKLALHQMSYSGLGYMSGGPLGGRAQASEYSIDCRWIKENLMYKAQNLHELMSHIKLKITCGDFAALIDDNPNVFLYLDPPYYEKGNDLYRYSMSEDDHVRLAGLLKTTPNKWVLSYDDHPKIRELYNWADFALLEIIYTTSMARESRRPKNREVLITHNDVRKAI